MSSEYEEGHLPSQRVSRWGLYLPTGALLVLAIAWSGFWWTTSVAASGALDAWLAKEAAQGRTWACADKGWSGYPFRLEFSCTHAQINARVGGNEAVVTLGGINVVSQIYSPKLLLASFTSPLRVQRAGRETTLEWDDLHASLRLSAGKLQRLSIVSQAPQLNVQRADGGAEVLHAKATELHVRTDTELARSENALDVAIRAEGAAIPTLDRLTDSTDASDLAASLIVTHAKQLEGRGWERALTMWRAADGRVDVLDANLDKGPIHVQTSGVLQVDAEHRPKGQLTVSATGAGATLARLGISTGGGVQKALDGLFGKRAGAVLDAAAAMRWPVRLENGNVYVGPVKTSVILEPLY